jgi:hypothetical protein
MGVQIPPTLIDDCVRLCCSLCLLENDPSVIELNVLSKDRDKFAASGDARYVDKAHRRGKIGWKVGTWRGRAVPKVVPRRGSVVHRELVEKVLSGFGQQRTAAAAFIE